MDKLRTQLSNVMTAVRSIGLQSEMRVLGRVDDHLRETQHELHKVRCLIRDGQVNTACHRLDEMVKERGL